MIDINKLIPGTSELLRRTLGENIEIQSVLAGGLWKALVDRSQLENALLNLAINARDAMPGGGKLTIETANANLDSDYAKQQEDLAPGQYVMIAVSDTGSGMAADVLHRVFDPFFTTKDIGEGSGLGLSMVYGFAKQSGGHAAIYSEPGHGTSVKIYVPKVSGAEQQTGSATAAPADALRGGGETLLVVEDDEAVREIVAATLRSAGYEVVEASNGEAALAHLAARQFDLLITDVILPGNLTCRDIATAAVARHPGIHVLYISGYARNAIVHQGRLDDDVELLTKPFTREALITRVRDVLDSIG